MADHLLEAVGALATFSSPTVSPDGTRVALLSDHTGAHQLHVLDVAAGTLDQWTDSEDVAAASSPIFWSRDGSQMYLHVDDADDERTDIYAVDDGGEAEPVVETAGQTRLLDVGSDGETLLYKSTADGQMNLYVYARPLDSSTRITDYDTAVSEAVLSPACDRVAYTANDSTARTNRDVFVVDIDGSAATNLDIGEEGAQATVADWGPGGTQLLVGDTSRDTSRCGLYHLPSGDLTWLGSSEAQETPVGFTPDGGRVLARRTRDAADVGVLYSADSHHSRELLLPDGVTSFPSSGPLALADGRLLVAHETPTSRPTLEAYDVAADGSETLFDADYGSLDPDRFRGETFYTITSDGVADATHAAVDLDAAPELEIECLLYDSGERPSPLVVHPHAGEPFREKRDFDLTTQFLLARGYSVLTMNYRGSTGQGRSFREALDDGWGGAEQGDIAVATEHALETTDWLDPDRVIVLGHSFGGYCAYWQLVQYPELYAAGIARVGVTDLSELYETSMPHYRTGVLERYLGTPAENPDLYEQRSPVTHVDNVSGPVLMLHGVADPRCPISQARLFRDALLDAGYQRGTDGDFEYHEFDDQGHEAATSEQKTRAFRLIDEFLSRRMAPPQTATHST